jgi:hypothetical protein
MVSDLQTGFFDANALAYTFGAALAYFVFVFLFGLIGAKIGGKEQKGARIGFAVGAFGILAIVAFGEYRIRQELAKDISASAQQMTSQMRAGVGMSTAAGGNSRTPEPSGLSAREAAAVNLLLAEVRSIYAESKEIGDDFQQQLSRIVGEGILQPAKLDTGPKISLAESKLMQLRQLIEKRQTDCEILFRDMPRRLNALPIDARTKESAIRGLQSSLAHALSDMRELTDAGRKGVVQSQLLAEFMRSRLGRFRIEDGTVHFDEDADVARYNIIFNRLQQAAKKEQEVTQRMQQNAQRSIDSFEQLFKQ